uniref:hypothetical protein n=1 Tax=Borreliella californiensis TaxID=373543 RepID=UPI003B20F5E1
MNDLYVFSVNKNHKNIFFISFRGLFNREKINEFNFIFLKIKGEVLRHLLWMHKANTRHYNKISRKWNYKSIYIFKNLLYGI